MSGGDNHAPPPASLTRERQVRAHQAHRGKTTSNGTADERMQILRAPSTKDAGCARSESSRVSPALSIRTTLAAWLERGRELPVGALFCILHGPTRGRLWAARCGPY